jgi:hypothetical protein
LNLRLTGDDSRATGAMECQRMSGVCKMRILQQNIAVLADNAANLVIQLRELEQLREQLKRAQQSARRSRQIDRRKRTRIRWLELSRRLRRR